MNVIKFGGTSIGTVDFFKDVVKIIVSYVKRERTIVVISAISGVTNKLIQSIEEAEKGSIKYLDFYSEIEKQHHKFNDNLVCAEYAFISRQEIELVLANLKKKLDGISLLHHASPKIYDSVIASGELLSQILLVNSLRSIGIDANSYDARKFIITDSNFKDAEIIFDVTNKKISETFSKLDRNEVAVINGFTGSTRKGETTTFGRSGSDYTATIIGAALNVNSVDIWTDVDGIFSADPQIIKSAENIPQLTYREAMELSSLGARVIFPKSVLPVESKKIPIKVLNSFNPESKGSLISSEKVFYKYNIISITSLNQIDAIFIKSPPGRNILQVFLQIINQIFAHKLTLVNINYSNYNNTITLLTQLNETNKTIQLIETTLQNYFEDNISLEVESGNGIVSVLISENSSVVEETNKIVNALSNTEINYRVMCSYNSNVIQLIINSKLVIKTIEILHDFLFKEKREANVA